MYVKVCGITRLEDALEAVQAGAEVLGFNVVPSSRRYLEPAAIRRITDRLRVEAPRTICVAVVADVGRERARALLDELGVERLQLHGDEPGDELLALGDRAFKALRVGDADDVERARSFPGHPLLVDAKVAGQLGGTGHRLDWALVAPLARARPLILAGGLTPENVAKLVTGRDLHLPLGIHGTRPEQEFALKSVRVVRACPLGIELGDRRCVRDTRTGTRTLISQTHAHAKVNVVLARLATA